MRRVTHFTIFFAILSVLGGSTAADEVDFNRDIRPLLSDKCFHCHGPDAEHREAELRLDVESAAKAYAVQPGDLDSELIVRVTSDDPDSIMPPPDSGKQLDALQIKLLKRWIEQGAKWQQHWAYVPPVEHSVPDGKSANWIDRFIQSTLATRNWEPSPEADRVTLVRRLYFDLVGLPPSPQEVERFCATGSFEAYEQLVDQLLESPHFGERMAVYWLDLVRYADTVGYHGDQDQNISPYRDYVIDAFNRNLSFDQFTREQLAGDLLKSPTVDQKIATGYNRLLQTSHEGGVQPKEYLTIYQADRVRNLSSVWMGGTLGCAQCHDHKYDPYTAADFYSMAAFFADIDEEQHFKTGTNALPTARPPEMDVLSRAERAEYAKLEELLASLEDSCEEADKARAIRLRNRQKMLDKRRRRTMISVALEQPRVVRLLPRGNWLDESGPEMQPAIPQFLGRIQTDRRATRLDLANWLVDTRNGVGLLTARVMVNRFWYLAFGVGLSESLDDFGGQGKPPNHPELLDNLAIDFAQDWDVKRLMKMLVMTETYRQSSRASATMQRTDPANRFFARQSRFRLPAEMIRDVALASGNLLVDELGGPSVRPYQPPGYYRHLNFPKRRYAHHGDKRQWRRGVYVHWQRQFLHPMLKAFDAPSREECTARRPKSNTPLAALVLLNDPTFVEAARGLAARVLAEQATDDDRIRRTFEIVVSRAPNSREQAMLHSLLEESRKEYRQSAELVTELLEVGEAKHLHDDPQELAAWTTVARAVLNLSEATTRQ